MKNLADYRIPFGGLKNGTHYFNFEVDGEFWDSFPDRLVESGRVFVDLQVDKRNRVTTLRFDLGGQVAVECDRCTAGLELPVTGHYKLYAKPRQDSDGESEELILVSPDEPELDLSQLLYELIQVSLPMLKTCEELPGFADMKEEDRPCNQTVISQLSSFGEEQKVDPRWAGLQDLKKRAIANEEEADLENDGKAMGDHAETA